MRVWVATLSVLLYSSTASAEDFCDFMLDPAEIGLRDSGFDQSRTACIGTSVRSGARATVLIAADDFYGTLASSVFAGLRYELSGFELEAGARVIDYRFAQNAVLTESESSIGPVFIGATIPVSTSLDGMPVVLAGNLRLDIPGTDSGYSIAVQRLAAGAHASLEPAPKWALHGRIALLWETAFPDRGPDHRYAVSVSTDTARRINSWFSLGGGLEFQSGWHGQGLDHMLGKVVFRFLPGRNRIDLSVGVPIVGSERTNLAVQLGYARAL